MKTTWDDVLDCFLWGMEFLSRKDCGLILAGIRQCKTEQQADRLMRRMARQRVVRMEGNGPRARLVLTPDGARHLVDPEVQPHWNTPWDGKWRLFTYDLPEQRRTERIALWRTLRTHRLGLLQRSVWVWPHNVEPLLRQVLQVTGLPECFCGFTAERLFLCSNEELVASAWPFEDIDHDHRDYLETAAKRLNALGEAGNLQRVAEVAANERAAYRRAFGQDPLLPRQLWPADYQGQAVERAHVRFRTRLRTRAEGLAGK